MVQKGASVSQSHIFIRAKKSAFSEVNGIFLLFIWHTGSLKPTSRATCQVFQAAKSNYDLQFNKVVVLFLGLFVLSVWLHGFVLPVFIYLDWYQHYICPRLFLWIRCCKSLFALLADATNRQLTDRIWRFILGGFHNSDQEKSLSSKQQL